MNKIVIIDGNSLIFRAYYAVPAFFSPEGVPTGAVYGFANMLFRIMAEHPDATVAVAFDVKEKTFRHKMYPEYKGTRKKTDDDLLLQFPIAKDLLGLLGIPVLEAPGYEADDILGTLAYQAMEAGMDSAIYTGDKDALQLVRPHSDVYITLRGVSSTEKYDEAKVLEKMGVTPSQIVDYKSLKGDASDNIPGAKGIGDKTAIKLLSEYGSTENILANIEAVKPSRISKILSECRDMVLLSKELATVSVEAPVSLEDVQMGVRDEEGLLAFFKKYGFTSLIKKFQAIGVAISGEELSASASADSISSKKKTSRAGKDKPSGAVPLSDSSVNWEATPFAGADCNEPFGELDVPRCSGASAEEALAEVSLNAREEEAAPVFIGLSLSDGAFDTFYVYGKNLWVCSTLEDFVQLKPLLENENIKKQVFSSKELYLFCFQQGIDLKGVIFDVTIAAYLLNPSRKDYSIEGLAKDFGHAYRYGSASQLSLLDLGMDESDNEEDGFCSLSKYEHVCYFAGVTKRLTELLGKALECSSVHRLFVKTELPLVKVLADIEHTGFRLSTEVLREIGKDIEEKIARLQSRIHELAGEEFNISSPKQLGVILFEKLELPKGKKTKTGYSTNKDILEKLSGEYEIARLVIEYRSYTKLKSSYVDSLLNLVVDGRIHTSLNQKIAVTGRLSSTEPNLQNIPIRLEEGRNIRKAFLADEGCVLLSADYSQIELRVLAHLSGDEKLMKAFNEEADVHRVTASQVFGVAPEEVTSLQRSHAKEVNFGIIYGMGDFGLSESLGISVFEARNYIEKYFETYSRVREYMEGIVQEATERRYVETILGRKRMIPELSAKNRNIRAHGERMARNTVVQGSAADIIKIAMIRLYEKLRENGLQSKIILQIHDELVLNVPESEQEEVRGLLREAMEGAYPLNVPLKVSMSTVTCWYDAK